MLGIIYKDGQEIDRGIYTGGKHYAPAYPGQSISICDSCDAYEINGARVYHHGDGISFKEYQDDGHMAYDSNEGVDRTIHYPLPSWATGSGPIPNYKHSLDHNGQEQHTAKGWVK